LPKSRGSSGAPGRTPKHSGRRGSCPPQRVSDSRRFGIDAIWLGLGACLASLDSSKEVVMARSRRLMCECQCQDVQIPVWPPSQTIDGLYHCAAIITSMISIGARSGPFGSGWGWSLRHYPKACIQHLKTASTATNCFALCGQVRNSNISRGRLTRALIRDLADRAHRAPDTQSNRSSALAEWRSPPSRQRQPSHRWRKALQHVRQRGLTRPNLWFSLL